MIELTVYGEAGLEQLECFPILCDDCGMIIHPPNCDTVGIKLGVSL